MTRILALDLGTRMGYAVAENGKLLISATRQDKPGRYSGGGMRFLQFRRWLQEVYESAPFERVYFEEVRRHLSTDAAHVYGGLLAMLTSWCEERGVAYEGLTVQSIKIDACGKGNAKKQAVIVAMNARWGKSLDAGEKTKDDNEADALAILHSALLHEPALAKRPRRIFKG